MKRFIVLLLIPILLTACTGRSRSSRRKPSQKTVVENTSRRNSSSRQRKNTSNSRKNVVPKEPEQQNTIIHDTVIMVVPTPPEIIHDTIFMVVPMQPENQYVPYNEGDIVIPSTKKMTPVVCKNDLPKPPRIIFKKPSTIYTREQYIEHFDLKGDMKHLIIACDYDNPTVRNNAVALVALSPGSFNLGQICDIYDFCRQNWSYVNDPISADYYAKASETIKNGFNGDCDDFAILMCSMILSIGGDARISFAYNNEEGHAFTEVNIGTTDRTDVSNYLKARYGNAELWHKEENGDWWLNLDWWGYYPGAEYYKYVNGQCFNIIRNTYHDL